MTGWLKRAADRLNHTLDAEEIPVTFPGLPAPLEGLRLLVFGDLHYRGTDGFALDILRTARAHRPDMLLICGDVLDEQTRPEDGLGEYLAALGALCPAAAVLGNNDCIPGTTGRLREMYRAAGILLLENESRDLHVGGAVLRLIGLTDPRAFELELSGPREKDGPGCVPLREAAAPSGEKERNVFPVVIVHRPELVPKLTVGADLFVSGHAHGGQFRLPGGQGLYAPGQGVFPRRTGGLYREKDGSLLFVTRGLGNHGFNLRLNNRPHLPLLILQGGGTDGT